MLPLFYSSLRGVSDSIADHSYYKIGCYTGVGRNYRPYLALSLYPFLSQSFWCVHEFCVIDLVCFSMRQVHCVCQKRSWED